MTKEGLERIKQAYNAGLKVQIWFNGNWEDFDIRDYSMYSEPFSENRHYRIIGSAYADVAEKRIAELEEKISVLLSCKNCPENKGGFICAKEYENKCLAQKIEFIKELQKENAELKADNDARKFAMAMSEKVEKQLREENAELRKEWQEQVQKATDEGYARTLQTIQLTNAKELLKNILAISVHDKRQCTYDAYILTVKEAEQFLKDSEVEK